MNRRLGRHDGHAEGVQRMMGVLAADGRRSALPGDPTEFTADYVEGLLNHVLSSAERLRSLRDELLCGTCSRCGCEDHDRAEPTADGPVFLCSECEHPWGAEVDPPGETE